MSNDKPQRTGQNLQIALTNAKQNVTLLRRQLKTRNIDKQYFDQRLESLGQLLEELQIERRKTDQQQRLAKLYEVSRMIGSSLNLETVLEQVMDAIILLTGAERGFLMLLDDDANLAVKVARNFDQETLESNEIAFSRTITRQAFESGDPVVTTNALEDPRFSGQASVIAHSMRSVMASPLRARGQIIGVIYVDNTIRTGLFRDEDLEALDAFATQAGVALDNARLYAETDAKLQERVEELQILQWIDRQLNETLEPTTTMQLTLEWATRLCKAQVAGLGLNNAETNCMQLTAFFGDDNEFEQTPEIPFTDPLVAELLETERPVVHSTKPGKTTMGVPIRLENAVIGLMVFAADRADGFDENAQELVSRMADRAAISLQNSRLYNAAREANQAKTEFISLVAHELKVPMTSIRGYASMMDVIGQLNDQQREFAQVIVNNVERMKILVDDLSDISRIESGNMKMNIAAIDIGDALAQAKDGVMTQVQERGHTFTETIEAELPLVKADSARLVQVLVNLLSNAYKYTPDGGTITLTVKRTDQTVTFSVQDTGIGMTEAQLAKLGTKFYRVAEHDHVAQQSGTGLGFTITRNLIDMMQGELEIESEAGKGSLFRFSLPIAEKE